MPTKSSAENFTRKWGTISSQFGNTVPYPVLNQVYQLDRQHLETSGYDYSQTELEQMIGSAASGKSITAPQQSTGGNFLSNTLSDVAGIGRGLMGLVDTGLHDIEHPTHIGSQVSAIWRDPKAAAANLVPGAADIETVLQADPHLQNAKGLEALLKHPVSSVLDVLPLAKGLGSIAGKAARAGLDESARTALEDASRFKPSDYSPEARAARASAKQLSRTRQLAIASEKGLPSLLREAVLGGGGDLTEAAPSGFDVSSGNFLYSDQWTGTRGEKLANFLNRRSQGQLGPLAVAEGRRLAPIMGTFLHERARIAERHNPESLINLWSKHGLAEKARLPDPETRSIIEKLWTQGATDEEIRSQYPELADKLIPLFADLQDRYVADLNDEIKRGNVQQIVDPRDQRSEFRATRGTDKRVITASEVFHKRKGRANAALARFNAETGMDIPLDPKTAAQSFFSSVERRLGPAVSIFTELDTENLDAIRSVVPVSKRYAASDLRFAKKVLGPSGSLAQFMEALRSGDLAKTRKLLGTEGSLLSNLSRKQFKANPLLGQVATYLKGLRRPLDRFGSVEKELKKYQASFDRYTQMIDKHPSAEFQPAYNELVKDQALLWLSEHNVDINPEDLSTLYEDVSNATYRGRPFVDWIGPHNFARIKQAALTELVTMRNEGFTPRFAYSSSPGEVDRLLTGHPTMERISSIPSGYSRAEVVPKRLYDPVIGLIKHAEDKLEHDFAVEYWFGENGFLTHHGKGFDDVKSELLQTVPRSELDRAIESQYVKVDPRGLFPTAKSVATGVSFNNDIYVNKEIHAAAQANFKAYQGSDKFGASVFRRGTRIFRWSLLNFSPRYQLHIAGGGLMLLLLRSNPWAIGRDFGTAFGMGLQDTPELFDWAQRGPVRKAVVEPLIAHFRDKAERLGHEGVPGQIAHALPEADTQGLQEAFAYSSGHKVGKWLDEAMSKRGLNAGLELANFNANMLRAIAYLNKGGGEEGIAFANKVFADMNGLSPAERSLIKYIIPFYGWTRHILKYVSTYPVDHPYRAMVLSNATEQYWEEWNSGFPQKLVYLFTMGTPDAQGNVKAVDLRQLDPLRNAVDIFTMAGAMSALNPAWQTLLQGFGIDPVTAQPDNLYSTMTYDTFSGSISTSRPNPLQIASNGVFNYIPEASVLDHFLQVSGYTRYLAQNEPQQYRQQLYQSLNFPWIPQSVNVYQTIAKNEAHQYTVVKNLVQSSSGTGAMYSTDPNSAEWGALFKYAYVPYQSWMVQPAALRYWVWAQAPINDGNNFYQGYWAYKQAGGTLPPAAVINPPSAPRVGANPYAAPFAP